MSLRIKINGGFPRTYDTSQTRSHRKSGQDRYRQAMLEYLLHRSDQFQTVNGLMV